MGTLNVKDGSELCEKIPDVEIVGNPNSWVLICKASSQKEGWMKSTKAMQLENGILVQVTTQQGDNVSEALCYCPGESTNSMS